MYALHTHEDNDKLVLTYLQHYMACISVVVFTSLHAGLLFYRSMQPNTSGTHYTEGD